MLIRIILKKIQKQKQKNNSYSTSTKNIVIKKNKSDFLHNYLLSVNGEFAFFRKGVLCNEPSVIKEGECFVINLDVFYRTKLLVDYRRRLKLIKFKKYLPKKFADNIKKNMFFKTNQVLVRLTCLNRLIDKDAVNLDHIFYKSYRVMLFLRNFDLWLDFIKATNLVATKHLESRIFLQLLGSLFKHLHKRKHNRFILFVSNLFDHLMATYANKIKGIKLKLSGRLLSKPRSSVVKIERGTLNLTCKNVNVDYNQMHVYTLYGAFGLKLYLNYQE